MFCCHKVYVGASRRQACCLLVEVSSHLVEVTVWRDGKENQQEYSCGKPVTILTCQSLPSEASTFQGGEHPGHTTPGDNLASKQPWQGKGMYEDDNEEIEEDTDKLEEDHWQYGNNVIDDDAKERMPYGNNVIDDDAKERMP